ncbi:MAG: hypothetical protein KBE09_02490 [Candidatus Pacebacteria bacterium]|nr:hypothetical protein [Candidatus Paceibacterota bacterium]
MDAMLFIGKWWFALAASLCFLGILAYAYMTRRASVAARTIAPALMLLNLQAKQSPFVRKSVAHDRYLLENGLLLIRCKYTYREAGVHLSQIVVYNRDESAYWMLSMAGDECQLITLMHSDYRKTQLLAIDLRSRRPDLADALSELTHHWGRLGRGE